MTTHGTRHPADERLLDAALQQVYADTPSAESDGEASDRVIRRSPWLQAATFLLGLTVIGVVFWQAREQDSAATPAPLAQDPAPFGIPAKAEGRAEIEALPAGRPT